MRSMVPIQLEIVSPLTGLDLASTAGHLYRIVAIIKET